MEFVRVEPPGCDLAVVGRPPQARPGRGSLAFVHGLGDASSAFAAALESPSLAPFEVVLVDLLGHGVSDKPLNFDYRPASHAAVLFQALRALRPRPPLHLLGYSLGAAVALELSRFPVEGLASLILVEPALEPAQVAFATRVASTPEGEFRARFGEFLEPYGGEGASLADRHWAETAAFSSSTAFHRSAKGLVDAASRGELIAHFKETRLPRTLILTPETYEAWPAARQAEAQGARVVLVDSPSKMPMYDAPEALYSAAAFATGPPPPR